MSTGSEVTTALAGATSGHLSAAQQRKRTIEGMLEKSKPYIAQALPKHMTPERLLRVALTAINTTPQLGQCTPASLVSAVVSCSQLGLEPNTPLGHAYLVPFKSRDEMKVQVIIGYKGLIDLARRSGNIVSISARTVHQHDEFKVTYGIEENIEHHPKMDGDRGPLVAVYAVAHLKGGGVAVEVMSRAEVDSVRNESAGYKMAQKYKKDTPWTTHYDEMARKTVIRKLAKYLPMSIEDRQFGEAAATDTVRPEPELGSLLGVDDEAGDVIDLETGEIVEGAEVAE